MDTTGDELFVEFVRRHGHALARTAHLLTGDETLAEDLVQTALAKTYVRWRGRPDIADLDTYVRTVLVRTHLTWKRRLMSTERPVEDAVLEVTGPDIADRMAERQVLLTALQQLPGRQRATLVLRYFDDLSEADTARALGCSTGSVKQHSSRGLARLRGLLTADAVLLW